MIQDIFPKKLRNEYSLRQAPKSGDKIFVFEGTKILIKYQDEGKAEFPKFENFSQNQSFIYLFAIDEENFFLANNFTRCLEGFEFVDVKEIRYANLFPKYLMFAVYTAKHLADWYRDNQYCGRCGKQMVHSEKERAMKCSCCGYTSYPRIMPAVIVGVINKDKILITRYKTGFQHNALIAGFTEIGETAEETVIREVKEEAGIQVKNIRYYKTQPWGSANDLLLGYFCELDGNDQISMDTSELKFAQWLSREELELQPDDFSLTNEMMMQFKNNTLNF